MKFRFALSLCLTLYGTTASAQITAQSWKAFQRLTGGFALFLN